MRDFSRKSKGGKRRTAGFPKRSSVDHTDSGASTWVDHLVFRPIHEVSAGSESTEVLNEQFERGSTIDSACLPSARSGDPPESKTTPEQNHETLRSEQTSTQEKSSFRYQPQDHRTQGKIDTAVTPGSSISIISWNILAESYCSPRSHVQLPPRYRRCIFDPPSRRRLLCNTLSRLAELADVLALQEVDLPDVARHLERRHGWVGVETPRTKGGGAGGRCDSVAVFVDPQAWQIMEHEIVRLDDLATLTSDSQEVKPTGRSQQSQQEDAVYSDNQKAKVLNGAPGKEFVSSDQQPLLHGFQQSFLRRNVALLVRLRSRLNPDRTVVVATAHLYWHPGYEYVKLCQIHYVLQRARRFCRMSFDRSQQSSVSASLPSQPSPASPPAEPLIFCGDLNSRPEGAAYHYLTRGTINAKLVAPWFHQMPIGEAALLPGTQSKNTQNSTSALFDTASKGSQNRQMQKLEPEATICDVIGLEEDMNRCFSLKDNSTNGASNTEFTPCIKYMLDNTLNKFSRWLRILGQDAALETDAQEKLRTREGVYSIFQQCQEERRTLVTTSRRMVQRRDCPPGTYWLSPTLTNNLELALVHLLLSHGVVLQPTNFLTRCVVCNGDIKKVPDPLQKRLILQSYDAPDLGDDMEVYQCRGCQQGYWWCDRPNSSASRVKDAAVNLFRQCLRAGVPCSSNLGMFDFVDIEAEQEQGWDFRRPGSELLHQQLEIIDWLRNEHLNCPVLVKSAYAERNELRETQPGEIIPFTNVTASFVNVLDYIFYNHTLRIIELLSIPRTFAELNTNNIPNGHLLPSDVWPSDHLAIGATFAFEDAKVNI